MRFLPFLLAVLLLLTGCGPAPDTTIPTMQTQPPLTQPPETQPAPTVPPNPIDILLESMTLEEQVGQLFLIRCNSETASDDLHKYHPAGLVLFGADFENQTPESVTKTIAAYQEAANLPLLIAVDEEGGTVTRVSRYPAFRASPFLSPRSLYNQGGLDAVLEAEAEKCILLSSLGINLNLGPVCDIATNSDSFMYQRSLGQDPDTTALFSSEMVQVMKQHSIGCALKHFPGYGNNADTHTGIAIDSRSLEELEGKDLIPFQSGIDAGAGSIMVSHNIVQCMDEELPASLSPAVHGYLRREMGFDGVIMTDDLVMEAITQQYGAGEAAVLAVLAGNDILCSTEYAVQYEAVLEAVLTERIDYHDLTDAVRRILKWKQALGLI